MPQVLRGTNGSFCPLGGGGAYHRRLRKSGGEKGDMVGVLVHTLYISDCVPKLCHQVVASLPRELHWLALRGRTEAHILSRLERVVEK